MDDETRAYFEGMETRLKDAHRAMEARLKDAHGAMETRLITRLDVFAEAITDRLRSCETSIAALTEVARSRNTTMSLVAATLGDFGRRLTDLEKKG